MCYTYDKNKGGDTRELQSKMVLPKKTGSSHLKWYYAMPRGHKHDPIYSLSINAAFRANFSSFSRLKRL